MIDVRKIEAAIERYLRSRKIVLGTDDGGLHFVILAGTDPRCSPLPVVCNLMKQLGESCGFDHDYVPLHELAKVIAEDLR